MAFVGLELLRLAGVFLRCHRELPLRSLCSVRTVAVRGGWTRRTLTVKSTAERAVSKEEDDNDEGKEGDDEVLQLWKDGRYGACEACGKPVQFPGLSHQWCGDAKCGWVKRSDYQPERKFDNTTGESETDFK